MSFVLRMIEEGEHQCQDFKLRIDDARKIAKTLSAFANTDGGRMLIGVRDNGEVAGCRIDEEYHMIQHAAEAHCHPAVAFETQVWKHNYMSVLEVRVPKSGRRPHFVNVEDAPAGQTYQAFLRKDDRILKASPVLVKVWQYEMRLDRSEFRYDEYVGRLFKRWREGQRLRFPQVARTARMAFEDAEDLLALLTVWGIVEATHERAGLRYGLADLDALDKLETEGADAFRWKHAG